MANGNGQIGQADKTESITITLPKSELEAAKDLALQLDTSVSDVLCISFFLMKHSLKKIPTLKSIREQHIVMQHCADMVKNDKG